MYWSEESKDSRMIFPQEKILINSMDKGGRSRSRALLCKKNRSYIGSYITQGHRNRLHLTQVKYPQKYCVQIDA